MDETTKIQRIRTFLILLGIVIFGFTSFVYGSYGEMEPTGAVGCWHLNDNSATESDSCQSNDGTVSNATFITNGVFGGAYSFDGGDYISINTLTGFDGDYGSIEAWVKDTDSSKADNAYFVSIRANSSYRIRFYVNTSDDLVFRRRASASTELTSDLTWTLDTWHYVVATWDVNVDDEVRIYLDGELAKSGAMTAIWSGTPTTNAIGSYGFDPPGLAWDGEIDAVRILAYPLSEAQIKQNFSMQKGSYGIN